MQLTTRQREFVRIAGWALLLSVALGAVFGRFRLERLPGGDSHPLESAAFSRRTPNANSPAEPVPRRRCAY